MRSVTRLHKVSICVVSSAVGSHLVQLGNCNATGDSQRGPEAVNTEIEGYTVLEAITRQRLVKTQLTEKTIRAVVNYRTRELAIKLELFVVTICKYSIYQITNPNPVHTHSIKS
jgi:hypothetical protein